MKPPSCPGGFVLSPRRLVELGLKATTGKRTDADRPSNHHCWAYPLTGCRRLF
jgi:hypothetical protein